MKSVIAIRSWVQLNGSKFAEKKKLRRIKIKKNNKLPGISKKRVGET